MNEILYSAYIQPEEQFRALNIESNLARPVIIQILTQSPGRYTSELSLRRSKLFKPTLIKRLEDGNLPLRSILAEACET